LDTLSYMTKLWKVNTDYSDNYGLGDRYSIPGKSKKEASFPFASAFRPALGSTHPPIKCVPELFPRGQSGQGVKLTTSI